MRLTRHVTARGAAAQWAAALLLGMARAPRVSAADMLPPGGPVATPHWVQVPLDGPSGRPLWTAPLGRPGPTRLHRTLRARKTLRQPPFSVRLTT